MSRPFRFLVAMLPPAAAVIVACGPARSDTGDPETLTDATHLEGPSADPSASARAGGSKPAPPEAASSGLRVVERTDPPRTHVVDANGALVASFTRAARTVVVYGRTRTLRERDVAFPTADLPPLGADDGDGSSSPTRTHVAPPVTTTAWVRVLAQPYEGTMTTAHWAWLRERRDDASDDVLAIAYRFTTGGPKDAAFGNLRASVETASPRAIGNPPGAERHAGEPSPHP